MRLRGIIRPEAWRSSPPTRAVFRAAGLIGFAILAGVGIAGLVLIITLIGSAFLEAAG